MKNIIAIVIIAVSINAAQAASPAQVKAYEFHTTVMKDVTIRNAFRRMEMVKIVNDISDGMKANIKGDSVSDWKSYEYRGVMDANDMGIIKNIIDPFFDNNPTPEGTKDANGNSVW